MIDPEDPEVLVTPLNQILSLEQLMYAAIAACDYSTTMSRAGAIIELVKNSPETWGVREVARAYNAALYQKNKPLID